MPLGTALYQMVISVYVRSPSKRPDYLCRKCSAPARRERERCGDLDTATQCSRGKAIDLGLLEGTRSKAQTWRAVKMAEKGSSSISSKHGWCSSCNTKKDTGIGQRRQMGRVDSIDASRVRWHPLGPSALCQALLSEVRGWPWLLPLRSWIQHAHHMLADPLVEGSKPTPFSLDNLDK